MKNTSPLGGQQFKGLYNALLGCTSRTSKYLRWESLQRQWCRASLYPTVLPLDLSNRKTFGFCFQEHFFFSFMLYTLPKQRWEFKCPFLGEQKNNTDLVFVMVIWMFVFLMFCCQCYDSLRWHVWNIYAHCIDRATWLRMQEVHSASVESSWKQCHPVAVSVLSQSPDLQF